MQLADIPSLRVTVMGLGLHGGGLASALFFAHRGARVTVTDNREDPEVFRHILPSLIAAGVRTVLGRHDKNDFIDTDLIIKNPAVPSSSPFLDAARAHGHPIETDLSVFLQLCSNPLIGVTGSKGKSTTASAIHHCLQGADPGAKLGGNITVSPLTFIDCVDPQSPIVLELSSWQLADVRGRGLLAPRVSVVTVILPDHQDKYPVSAETRARPRYFSSVPLPLELSGAYLQDRGAVIREADREISLSLDPLSVPGQHNRLNLLAAGLACHCYGISPDDIAPRLRDFPGIEHRLELTAEIGGIRYYNDSAATIPQATAAALAALDPPILLITGGTDKNLDFQALLESLDRAEAVILLRGSATEKMQALFNENSIAYEGPFPTLEEALKRAASRAGPGASVLFSPGCASFELFLNEFDRGRKFKELVQSLTS
jgi:UDP-N-acetylmuramoylalanine--D-glutamate ligase